MLGYKLVKNDEYNDLVMSTQNLYSLCREQDEKIGNLILENKKLTNEINELNEIIKDLKTKVDSHKKKSTNSNTTAKRKKVNKEN